MTTDRPNTCQLSRDAHADGSVAAGASLHELLPTIGEMLAIGGAVAQVVARLGTRGKPTISVRSIEWMDSCHQILELPQGSEVSVRSALRRIRRRDRRTFIDVLRSSIREGRTFEQTLALQGGKTWIGVTVQCSPPSNGSSSVSVVFQDVTEHRKRETALRRELLRQDQMAEMSGIGTWTLDLQTSALTWSDQVFHIHEMEPGPMPSLAEAVAFYPPKAAATVEERLQRAIRMEERYELVVQMMTAKGNPIWVHTVGEAEFAPDGTPLKIIGSFRDVTEEREAEAKLRASEEQHMFALEGSNDGLWDWDIEHNSVHYSKRWKELIGYEDHELDHEFEEWYSRVSSDDQPTIDVALKACLAGETPAFHIEFQMLHKDGAWRWILSRGKVVARDEAGNPLRMVGTHTDISDQVAMRRGLVAAKESAEQAAIAKSEFLATMSHEIRTPLNGILGLSQLLLDTHLEQEQSDHLRVIFSSGSALLEILNDILDLSKVESGKVQLESIPFSPKDCAKSTLALLQHKVAEQGDLKMELRVEDHVPERIMGDPARLRQILLNLVGNAVKFTEKGTIRVTLSTLTGANGQDDLRIAVRDTGIGITAESAAHLFESFTQADSSTTRRFGGTGLGLSISRNLVNLMNGTIACRPAQGGGSVFWIEVPIHRCESDAHRSGPTPPAPLPSATHGAPTHAEGVEVDDPKKIHALVVEDNPINQIVARRMLEKMGCTVTTVNDGSQAVEVTAQQSFDIAFMDCQMPVMDGYEATRIIRAREAATAAQRLPIVAMTANAMSHDRAACLEAGMDDYVAKPVLNEVLREALMRGVDFKLAS